MNPEGPPQQSESKEKPGFKLHIVVTRHGEKVGIAGPLSSEGKEQARTYFDFVAEQRIGALNIEHSPVGRTKETASIFSDAIAGKQGYENIRSFRSDERLSEGGIAEHRKLIEMYGGTGGRWIKGWMDAERRPLPGVKTGKESAADFANWLLSKISDRQEQGGSQDIEAFSHAPVMIAFNSKLGEKLGERIMPEDLGIFFGSYLTFMDFYADSTRPDIVNFTFGKKKVEIPLSALHELVVENQFMANVLKDVSNEAIKKWTSNENLLSKNKRNFQGYEITDSIDGGINPQREVSLVKVAEGGIYPQHTHKESDATFIIVSGSGIFLSGDEKRVVKEGDKIKIPQGLPHGFELKEGVELKYVSIQSPPIRNPKTGEEDFQLKGDGSDKPNELQADTSGKIN